MPPRGEPLKLDAVEVAPKARVPVKASVEDIKKARRMVLRRSPNKSSNSSHNFHCNSHPNSSSNRNSNTNSDSNGFKPHFYDFLTLCSEGRKEGRNVGTKERSS